MEIEQNGVTVLVCSSLSLLIVHQEVLLVEVENPEPDASDPLFNVHLSTRYHHFLTGNHDTLM